MPQRRLIAHAGTVLACAALLAAPALPGLAQAASPVPAPAPAPAAPLPEDLVLVGDNIVTVAINGVPLRFAVSGDAFGSPVINPEVAARLALVSEGRRGWRFGPVTVMGDSADVAADFGAGPVPLRVSWADRPVTDKADGIIGIHPFPHKRVTFALRPAAEGETEVSFPLARTGGTNDARIGTEVTIGKKRMMMLFVTERRENLVTAPTANFIATHQEGGFAPGTDGIAVMDFAVERPTRMMRIAHPIELGPLLVERFAVRVEDYGQPTRVGEIAANDPRFEKDRILVSARKGRGRPDLLTRIGSDQIAHCSRLTYDLERSEIRLSCAPQLRHE
ncbi:MAG: hypothetical protein ACKO01_10580 [Erythrobacter sp.]